MRKLMLIAVATALFAAVTSVVLAASGPRLAGKFKVDATIRDNDFGVDEGTVTKDIFRFRSPCDEGACSRVKLDRKGGSVEHHYKSTLRRQSKGVYKGTEGPYPYDCDVPGGQNATFTAKHMIEVTRARSGKARKIAGRSAVTIAGCPFASFVNYTLKGVLDD